MIFTNVENDLVFRKHYRESTRAIVCFKPRSASIFSDVWGLCEQIEKVVGDMWEFREGCVVDMRVLF